MREPLRLLDKLGSGWRELLVRVRQGLRLPAATDWARALSSNAQLKWAITGDSSVTRYAMFSQAVPIVAKDLPPLVAARRDVVPTFRKFPKTLPI